MWCIRGRAGRGALQPYSGGADKLGQLGRMRPHLLGGGRRVALGRQHKALLFQQPGQLRAGQRSFNDSAAQRQERGEYVFGWAAGEKKRR